MSEQQPEHELARADREFEESISVPRSPYGERVVWMMDSEFCETCGCILDYFESVLCTDCLEDAFHDEDAAMYAGWSWDDEEEVPPQK